MKDLKQVAGCWSRASRLCGGLRARAFSEIKCLLPVILRKHKSISVAVYKLIYNNSSSHYYYRKMSEHLDSEKERNRKVLAATKIPRGARTGCFHLSESSFAQDDELRRRSSEIQVGIWTTGEITPLNSSHLPPFWPALVKIAPDCHAQNVKLCRVTGSQVLVQATKDIQSGQELFLWFEEEILVDEMGIPPYLSPANIRAGNSYICTSCLSSFEAPNNLKIHIALNCGSQPLSSLWKKLLKFGAGTPPPFWSQTQFNFASTPPTTTNSPNPMVHILIPGARSYQNQQRQIPMIGRPNGPSQGHTQFSHFPSLPIQHVQIHSSSSSGVHQTMPTPKSNPKLITSRASVTSTTNGGSLPFANGNSNSTHQSGRKVRNAAVEKAISVTVSDPEAQLESIVSNMGKGRNGHMCLYCGKLYSRKYGLKIHIRTHTGYKPLRCKICHRPFGDPSNLNKHIRLHADGNTPYRCDICNKVLVRKRDLERHIRSRHTTPVVPIPPRITLNCSSTEDR